VRGRHRNRRDIPFEHFVFDSSALIDMERSRDLTQLRDPGTSVWVPDRVAREVEQPGSRLGEWVRRNPRVVTRFETGPESSLYIRLLRQTTPKLHDGEAAAIAIAATRRATLVTNDKASKRKASEFHVRYVTHQAFLREWWRTRRRR